MERTRILDVNTTSKHPTHFLRAIELIKKAREDFSVPSENWPYPTSYRFGVPTDRYYAEIWTDGMDWQPSYWILEEMNYSKPQIEPLIIFEMNEDRMKFNDYDFCELVEGMMFYRRDEKWINKNDLGHYTDTAWPFLFKVNDEVRYKTMKRYWFEHASQQQVTFWINETYIPKEYRR